MPAAVPASAPGWRVAAIPGRVYPALVPSPSNCAQGLLLTDLSAEEWRVLDAFEDPIYDLREVFLADAGEGWAYACREESAVSAEEWDVDDFATDALVPYVDRCRRWRERYEP
jgi:hypothetical protein